MFHLFLPDYKPYKLAIWIFNFDVEILIIYNKNNSKSNFKNSNGSGESFGKLKVNVSFWRPISYNTKTIKYLKDSQVNFSDSL